MTTTKTKHALRRYEQTISVLLFEPANYFLPISSSFASPRYLLRYIHIKIYQLEWQYLYVCINVSFIITPEIKSRVRSNTKIMQQTKTTKNQHLTRKQTL